jgi:hypothetical protein
MPEKWRREQVAQARRWLAGALVCGTVTAGALAPSTLTAAAAGSSSPAAAALYRQALATTKAWSVHYSSASTQTNQTLLESGDAGPASGSQTVVMGKGSIAILVIGGFTYLKGNAGGLENLAGLSASQAAESAGQWIEFATDNAAFTQVVEGVRSNDIASELALKGPLSLGRPETLDGYAVEAIEGRQTVGRNSQHVVLYVRASGTHVPVEEDSVNAKGQRTDAEHIAYSKWGEVVRPQAPQATISIGPISAV